MAESMFNEADPSIRRVALVNAESRLAGQHGIQDQIIQFARNFSSGTFVLTHNGGNAESVQDDFKYGCRIKTYGVSENIVRTFEQPKLKEQDSEVFPWALREELMTNRHDGTALTNVMVTDGIGIVSFRRGVDIRIILSMIDRAAKRVRVESDSKRWPILFIVTGAMGGRGISYKSSDHKMHLTDEYLYIKKESSRQHTSIQLASRLCGRYPEDNLMLRMWCSEQTWRLVSGMVRLEDKIVKVARKAYRKRMPVYRALQEARFPKYEHIEHLKNLRVASPKVMRLWIAKDNPRLLDNTVLLSEEPSHWDIRLNYFLGTKLEVLEDSIERPDDLCLSASRVLQWTPEILAESARTSLMVEGAATVQLVNVATDFVDCVLTQSEGTLLEEFVGDVANHSELNRRAVDILRKHKTADSIEDAVRDGGGTHFAFSNDRNGKYGMCPIDYVNAVEEGKGRDYADRTCRFVPARSASDGQAHIYIIRRRFSHDQIRSLPYSETGARVVLWHRFRTTSSDDGTEEPTVFVQARIEFDPAAGDASLARQALNAVTNTATWRPHYKSES